MLPIRPTHDNVFIDIFDTGVTMKDLGNGKVLHLLPDDAFGVHDPVLGGAHRGIRPRWALVLAVGPDAADDGSVKPGDIVLCDTMKWSRKMPLGRDANNQIVNFWNIKIEDILMVDEDRDGTELLKKFSETVAGLNLTVGHL